MILHVVFYEPKASATAEELSEFVRAIERASREIPTIHQVRAGRVRDFGFGYAMRSLNQKLSYMAVFEFNDLDAFKAYMAHEEHVKLAQLFWSACEQTMIVDVEAADPKLDGLAAVFGQTGY